MLKSAIEFAKNMEPKLNKMKADMVARFKGLDRYSKLCIVALLLWRLYCLLPEAVVPTIQLEFSTTDDLELLLAKLQPTQTPARVILISKHRKLDLQDPIRFSDQHANRHFIFQHGPGSQPVSLHCTGSHSALTIRAHNIEISNLLIEGCSRSAIYVELPAHITPSSSGNTTTLSNVTMVNNRADKGAAIYVARGFLRLTGVNATHNYASQGGAIYLAKGRTGLHVSTPSTPTPVVLNTFTRNNANKGGVVCAEGALLGVSILGAQFESNQAFHTGGVLYSTQLGAADASIVKVDGCSFVGNQAAQFGGALACEGNHEVSVSSCVVNHNSAGHKGGAFWLHSPFFGNLDVVSSTFKSNIAGCAVAAALTASDLKVTPTVSTTRRRRTALRANGTSTLSATLPSAPAPTPPSTPTPNTKSSLGGAIHISGNFRVSIVKKSKLISNSAASGGGAISCIDCASVKVSDTGFTDNAAASGGALYLQLLKGSATVSSSSFIGNRAIWATDAKTASGSASGSGSASVAANATKLDTKVVSALRGVCGRSGGGAICLEAAQGASVKISGSAFEENTAYSGGAVYANLDACARKGDQCTVDVATSTFHANSARFSGGALHFTDMAGVTLNCPLKQLTAINASRPASAAGSGSSTTNGNSTATNATSGLLKAINATKLDTTSKGKTAKLSKSTAHTPAKSSKSTKSTRSTKSGSLSRSTKNTKSTKSLKKPSSKKAPPSTPSTQDPLPPFKPVPAPLLCSRQLKSAHVQPSSSTPRSRCSNTFTDNTVSLGYGHHVSSRVYCLEPTRSPIVNSPSAFTSSTSSDHVRIANEHTFSYTVSPFDFFLQHVNVTVPDISIASEASPDFTSSLKVSSPLVSIQHGEANLPNVSVTGNIGTHSIFIQARLGGRVLASTPLTVDVRTCEVGEVTSGRSCQSCDHAKGWTFSFDPSKTKCETCPWNAFCRGWSIVPRDGYWQAHPRSTRVHACKLPGACKAPNRVLVLSALQDGYQQLQNVPGKNASKYQDALCSRGYEGPMCGACARGYGRAGEKCERCQGRVLAFLSVLLWRLAEAAAVAALVSVRIFSGHEFSRQAQKVEQDGGDKEEEGARGTLLDGLLPKFEGGKLTWRSERPVSAEVVKERVAVALADGRHRISAVAESLVLCWQLLRLLSSVPLALPPSIDTFLSLFTPSSLQVPLDCLLPLNTPLKALSRVSMSATTPIFTTAFLIVAWAVFLRKRNIPPAQLPSLLLEACLLTMFEVSLFYYPQVVSAILSTFSCHSLASPLSIFVSRPSSPTSPSHPILGYWAQDTTMTCYSPRHLSFALLTALPLLIAVAAIPPFVIYLFVRQHSKQNSLTQPKVYTRYGYLYTDYLPQYTFGHTLKFIFLLAACAIVQGPSFYFGSALQLIAFTALTGYASYWLLVNQPFAWSAMNLLAAASIAPATLTSATALVMQFAPSTGLLGWVAASLWLPALLLDGLVVGLLAGLLAVVLRPVVPVSHIKEVGGKLNAYIRSHKWQLVSPLKKKV